MLFLTLLKVYPGRISDQSGFLKRIKTVTPPSNVKVREVYFLFGQYDGAVVFEAPDLRTAKDFIVRISIPGVYKVETLPAIPVEEF